MLEQDGILMTAVDTGWITDERPHPTKLRLADEVSTPPRWTSSTAPPGCTTRSCAGEAGEDLHGCFLKDYAPTNW